MKKTIFDKYSSLDRIEQRLLISISLISMALISSLVLYVLAGENFVRSIYLQRSFSFFNKLIQNQDLHSLEYYLDMRKDIAIYIFLVWSTLSVFATSGVIFVNRFFFSEKKLRPIWIILICCLAATVLYLYNLEWKVTAIHSFFRGQAMYQIMNGNCPPMDALFGGEPLHYQWGYPWAAAFVASMLNVTPFSAYAIINVLSLAGCLWLLYKISNLLIDDPKVNIFSALFTLYCGTFIGNATLGRLGKLIPFYGGENRLFPILIKFSSNNGNPIGLVFFLLMVFATMKIFERKRPFFYGFLIALGATCCIFFYAAFGPGIIAWVGFAGLLWLTKYKDNDFKDFGRGFLLMSILIAVSVLAVSPYLRLLSSSGGFLQVEFLNMKTLCRGFFSFLLPSSLSIIVIMFFRKYLAENLNRRNLSLLVCLFLSSVTCYLFFHIPGNAEYKFLLLGMLPFGIIAGIAFTRIRFHSKWLALGLFTLLFIPSLIISYHQFASSPGTIFDVYRNAPFYENGTALESSDAEENSMYIWIRENTTMDTYFLDKETKIPVFAQRTLWVGFDTGEKLPGYSMTVPRIKSLHGYDDQEFSRRNEVAQNIFGSQDSMTEEEIVAYLVEKQLFVVVRDNNIKIPTDHPDLQGIFTSEKGRFKIAAPAVLKTLNQ